MRTRLLLTVTVISLALGDAGSAMATQYQLINLGAALGASLSSATGVNASGQVTGSAYVDNMRWPYIYSGGTSQLINNTFVPESTIQGGSGNAINNSGHVAGSAPTSEFGYGPEHAFLYNGGALVDLGDRGGNTYGQSINNLGQIVGNAYNSNGSSRHAFLYSAGTFTDLTTLTAGQLVGAYAINDSGQIAGYKGAHAARYSGGVVQDLGTFGGSFSAAYAINASGMVAGQADNADGHTRAFLFDGSTKIDLGNTLGGTDSGAYGINNLGQVVGEQYYAGFDAPRHGFLYTGGTMNDLNDLLDSSGVGWIIYHAHAINDNGWIAASATFNGGLSQGVLLVPVAEPTTWALAILASGFMWRPLRRRLRHV